jgi:hypothetical protein
MALVVHRFPGASPYRVEMASNIWPALSTISGRPCATTARYGRSSDAIDTATAEPPATSRPVNRLRSRVVNQNSPSFHRYHSGRTLGRPFESIVAKWHRRGSARKASISS